MVDLLRGIRSGQPIGSGLDVYINDVGLVARSYIEIGQLTEDEFPAALVVPTGPTTFIAESESYQAEWIVPIILYMRDDNIEARRHSELFSELDGFYRDVTRALHEGPPVGPFTLRETPDVGLELSSWQCESYAGETMAWGRIDLLVKYHEFMKDCN
jgi:hypothetical protein